MDGTVIDCDKQTDQMQNDRYSKISSKGGITYEFVFECNGCGGGGGGRETRKGIRIGEQRTLNELESGWWYTASRKEDAGAIRKKGGNQQDGDRG